ncbi:ankyrin repeat domain-containing protein [Wolbachia endosymbiont of Pentalonia nigronervosa]|uniref:ankyrin repeat domain-containing protein n=1 Tax=Wolbachia endosymbiont of Pentalonia nigronervosa TaxID=1301914 RepID=UPI00165EEEAD|nr:ankyrin repeat domain-containing protein [Wolbachia endosymbiont of Pentalonia nigronervosa]MBD0392129.1 ankyrin repeat domain-containing protein [Wolbachia endosymbiont of Pentalonia nigronervosa]
MNKLKYNEKDKIHFVWFMILVVCVVITYCYQRSKATENYKTMLQTAANSCSMEVVKLLVEDIVPDLSEIALHYAAGGGCLDTIKFLIIERKVNIDAIDKYAFKRTALHHAAAYGHLEIIKFLLSRGANPTIRGNDGQNPRDVAVLRSRHDKDKPYNEIIHLLYNAEKQHKSKQHN